MSINIDHPGNKEYHSSPATAHPNRDNEPRLPASGGELEPGLYRHAKERTFGNPVPLGLSAFALTAFVLSLINMGTRGVAVPNIVVSLAFGYGGLVQLLAGMWYVFLLVHSVGPCGAVG
jgi:hypothetical protein